jgi:hypothetical protein
MSGVTAIELGVDSCVMARVRVHRGATQISRVYGLQLRESLLPDSGRGGHLRHIRREKGFPRHARVVAWGVPEGTPASDPAARTAIASLLQAGFVIDAVLSPIEALALLAKQRPRPAGRTGAAWLALNQHSVAIAIVQGSELLFSRVFNWNYRPATTLREELLQRYSLVAHLAPELRHGFDVIRGERGAAVDAIVTCGDLPDLRALTMPLIEELDMEVETLDSFDGLQIVSPARAEEIAEKAPALRLATAAGVEGAARLREEPSRAVLANGSHRRCFGRSVGRQSVHRQQRRANRERSACEPGRRSCQNIATAASSGGITLSGTAARIRRYLAAGSRARA